jgi:hypothetical protein
MNLKEIEELAQKYKYRDLEDLTESYLYWLKARNHWVDEYCFCLHHRLSTPTIETCLKAAINAQITIELLVRAILNEFDLEDESMTAKEIQKMSESFIRHLIDICMHGGGEVTLEELPDNRARLTIKLADLPCIYKSDRLQFLQCAVNPRGDCQTCQFKEVE